MFDIEGFLKEIREKVIFYRRDFHKYTELAWREFRTSSLIGKYLLDMGCSIKLGKDIINGKERLDVPSSEVLKENYERALQEGAFEELSSHMIGGYTGVVGILKNGERNKVALRFDIDGVTVKESEKTKHIPFKEGFLLKMMVLCMLVVMMVI